MDDKQVQSIGQMTNGMHKVNRLDRNMPKHQFMHYIPHAEPGTEAGVHSEKMTIYGTAQVTDFVPVILDFILN
jgi:hypothetical protein